MSSQDTASLRGGLERGRVRIKHYKASGVVGGSSRPELRMEKQTESRWGERRGGAGVFSCRQQGVIQRLQRTVLAGHLQSRGGWTGGRRAGCTESR